MNSIEEYQNLVEYFKKVLEFYADKNQYHDGFGRKTSIDLDEGSQARFALEKVKQLDELNKKMQEDYDNAMVNMINIVEDNDIDPIKLIEEYKKFTNENNNV